MTTEKFKNGIMILEAKNGDLVTALFEDGLTLTMDPKEGLTTTLEMPGVIRFMNPDTGENTAQTLSQATLAAFQDHLGNLRREKRAESKTYRRQQAVKRIGDVFEEQGVIMFGPGGYATLAEKVLEALNGKDK